MNPIDPDDEERGASPVFPDIQSLIGLVDFTVYDDSDAAGVVALAVDRRTTILHVNPKFASFLDTTPDNIIGRSLNRISVNKMPHSVATEAFVTDAIAKIGTQVLREMQSGRFVEAYYQEGPRAGQTCPLKVYDIQTLMVQGDTMVLLGYVDKLTKIEYWIERSHLDDAFDGAWKPLARFFLAGHWRPYATSAAAILIPIITARWPAIGSFLNNIFGR